MRIPTGMKKVQSSASINNLILYCCDKCGTYSLAENHVVGAGSKNYHVLQSDEKQATAYDKAKAAAMDSVSSAERLAAYTVNICCDYSGLTGLSGPVSCPHCGAVQPWSAWPKKWSKGLILLWIVMGFLLWVGLAVAVNNSVFWFVELAFLLIPIVARIVYKVKRKRKIAELNASMVNKPHYYRSDELKELLESPHGELLIEYLQSKST